MIPLSLTILSQHELYIFPCQSIRLTQTESQRPDGGLIRNLGARALLLMRGLTSALEPLKTSRRGHQQRATRVSLARIVQQRRAHEPAHGPLESGARHSRDLHIHLCNKGVQELMLRAGMSELCGS